ncbi:DegT/DnrJ/EryC1/StrS family aminotransferase [Gracilimonas tropica]|uniref:DegT/DnrJ/EryC1/StrS family aminotransferase n=1 Tax=Gracilimonas tropica TaxID=454600 RepID=UPI00037F27A7|nr:DegT/DnrJ/EryC1/StrS family aminotransferase [Gracilimonas tropica]
MKVDFSPPYIDSNVKEHINDVLESGWITTGPKTKLLEDSIAKKYDIPACVGVNSWTSGAILFMKWWGIEEGDEIIIPVYTYAATALAVIHAGGVPVMVDVKDDFTIDENAVKEVISEKTKIIMPVDIAGITADYEALNRIVEEKAIVEKFRPRNKKQKDLGRILILSDAAHSLGAKFENNYSGTLCDVTIFSLHAVKNVTSAEGGIIALNLPKPFENEQLYAELRRFSLNGQTKDAFTKSKGGNWKYDIVEAGMKCNMPDLNAALALGQFEQYDELLDKRKSIYSIYNIFFQAKEWASVPKYDSKIKSSYHLYPVRLKVTEKERDAIIDYAAKQEVSVNVHFQPLPLLTYFKSMKNVHSYDNALKLYRKEISLPIYPQLSEEQAHFVCKTIEEGYKAVVEK